MPLLIPPMKSVASVSDVWKKNTCVEESDNHHRLDADAEGVVTGLKLTNLMLEYDAVGVRRDGSQNLRDEFEDISTLGLTPELPEWFDIAVSAKNHVILVRMGLPDRRFLGYQMENQQWVEFASDTTDTHTIPGSSLFGFDVEYDALNAIVAVGQKGKYSCRNKRQVAQAVKTLSETYDFEKRKSALIILIKKISESLKVSRILESLLEVLGSFNSKDQVGPAAAPDLVHASQHGWRLLAYGSVISRETQLPQIISPGKFVYPDYPLVEVFSVVIDNIDGSVDLYGTIAVDYAFGRQYIYNKKIEESESISQGHNLLLTGPTRSIIADDPFSITVDLKDRKSGDEVCEGFISWNIFSSRLVRTRYDKLLYTKIDGRSGSATVNFIVFSDSVEATFEVTLLKGDGEKPANVHGVIRAGSAYDSSTYSSVLFQKEIDDDKDIELCPGQLIPLSRSLVAVDISSQLKVSANLCLSREDEIANGATVFPAQPSGTSEKLITGRCGMIRVKVTWNTR